MFIKDPPVEITDSLVMLGSNEYPLYLVKGEGAAAIFEGGTGPMGPLVREQLEMLGISADLVRQVIVPHAHPDHVMGIPFLRELLPGATVLASKVAAGTLAHEKAVGFFCKLDAAITESLIRDGVITEAHRPEPLAEMKIPVDQVIAEGDTVEVDGLRFNVLATPGHSECSLSFHEPQASLLLSSDATPYYFPAQDCFWPNYFTSYADYLDSMRRLKALGAEILCLGHHGVVRGADDVSQFFDQAMAATEQYHGRIIAEAKSGKPPRQIAEQLGAEVHEKTQLLPLDFFQKNCGLMVKLSLKHEGMEVEK